jgi:DNA replication protein DnaC
VSSSPTPFAERISERLAFLRERADEHRQRMETDPEYRAKVAADELNREEEAKREAAEWRKRTARWEIEDARKSARIPARVWPLLDEGLEPTPAVKAVRDFMEGRETLLVLAGGVGCGKTVAACEAAERVALKQNPLVVFVKAIDLVRAGTFAESFWNELRYAHLAIIDDLGTEPLDEKGWALASLHSLLDARYDDLAKTILTSNLSLDAFLARYGADGGRLRDRLRESGSFMEIAGGSRRLPPTHWTEKAEG